MGALWLPWRGSVTQGREQLAAAFAALVTLVLVVWALLQVGVGAGVDLIPIDGNFPATEFLSDGSQEEGEVAVPGSLESRGDLQAVTVKLDVPLVDRQGNPFERPGLLLIRPLTLQGMFWDDGELDYGGPHGVNRRDLDTSLLARLPSSDELPSGNERESVEVSLQLKRTHGYLGVLEGAYVGEVWDLAHVQARLDFRTAFISLSLIVSAMLVLIVGLYRREGAAHVFVALYCLATGLTFATLSEVGSMLGLPFELMVRLRHATGGLSPLLGFLAVMGLLGKKLTRRHLAVVFPALLVGLLALFWPDTELLPEQRVAGQFTAVVCLVLLFIEVFRGSLGGEREARVLLGVILLLLFVLGAEVLLFSGMLRSNSSFLFGFYLTNIAILLLVFQRHVEGASRYTKLTEEIVDALMVVERDGTIVDVNTAGLMLLGSRGVGDNLLDVVDPTDLHFCRAYLKSDRRERIELRFPRPSGESVFVESVASSSGRERRLLVLRDITKRRGVEQRLLNAARMETLSIVARGIAHDYNNTLTAVLGQLTLLEYEVESIDRNLLMDIEDRIVGTSERTRRMLTLVRGGAQAKVAVDMVGVVEEASQLILGTLGEEIELVTGIEPGLRQVHGRSSELEQALLTLLSNARDMLMRQGGEGQIRLALERWDGSRGGVSPEGETTSGEMISPICLSVTDSGPPIPEEYRGRVWDPFFSSVERDVGVGVGLSIVQRVVKEHGGRVAHVTPEGGRGARFEMILPTISGRAPVEESVGVVSAARVLVAEDEPDIRELIVSVLQNRGFSVVGCANAKEAIEAWQVGSFDLLVTDVKMPPGENGIQLAARLRERQPGLGVLVVSGQVPEDQRTRRGWAFLDKPFMPEGLVVGVRKALLLARSGGGDD